MQDEEEYLISYVNLKNNLIKYQKNFSNLETLDKFYKNSNLYVGNDTGFMHISSALGLKCIGIFGDSPAYAYSAYSKNIKAVVPEGETLETTTHNTCGIHKVSTEKVFDTLKNLLN